MSTPDAMGLRERVPARRNRKTSELIAHELAQIILDGEFEEGMKLPHESDMLEELGVGRATLREALRLLETRGLLVIKAGPGGGPVVRRPSTDDFASGLSLVLQVEGASLIDVLDARRELEPVIARRAAEHASAAQLADLRRIVAGDSTDPTLEQVDHEWAFHLRLAEASGNVVLRIFNESVRWLADGSRFGITYSPKQHEAAHEAHGHILKALEVRDAHAAEMAMTKHLEDVKRYWNRHFKTLVRQPITWS